MNKFERNKWHYYHKIKDKYNETHIPKCHKIFGDCCCDIQCVKDCVEQKEKKELVVRESNTVINPWTMMVHF